MENFIMDILNQLIEEAIELKENTSSEFEKGKLFGYYECISNLYNQAVAFNLYESLPKNLREFKPESLLENI